MESLIATPTSRRPSTRHSATHDRRGPAPVRDAGAATAPVSPAPLPPVCRPPRLRPRARQTPGCPPPSSNRATPMSKRTIRRPCGSRPSRQSPAAPPRASAGSRRRSSPPRLAPRPARPIFNCRPAAAWLVQGAGRRSRGQGRAVRPSRKVDRPARQGSEEPESVAATSLARSPATPALIAGRRRARSRSKRPPSRHRRARLSGTLAWIDTPSSSISQAAGSSRSARPTTLSKANDLLICARAQNRATRPPPSPSPKK